MMSDKSAARAKRLLKMIAKQECRLESTNDRDFIILNFLGLRTVKCHRSWLAGWLGKGLILVSARDGAFIVTVTPAGIRHFNYGDCANFADQHRLMVADTVDIDGAREAITRNINESPLAKLYRPIKGSNDSWLDTQEFSAGERLRSDFEFANLGPQITASWDPTANLSSSKGARRPEDTISERAMDARTRLTKAVEAVGPELSGILLDVCCYLKGLEQIETERQWPRRSAKLILKAALSVLARHYSPNRKNALGKIRHWGGDGYRPGI